MRARTLSLLCLAILLLAAPARAQEAQPGAAQPGQAQNGDIVGQEPRRLPIPGEETLRRLAAPVRGNLSAEDMRALQQANEATAGARGRAPQQAPAQPQQAPSAKKSSKAVYGEIIVHK